MKNSGDRSLDADNTDVNKEERQAKEVSEAHVWVQHYGTLFGNIRINLKYGPTYFTLILMFPRLRY